MQEYLITENEKSLFFKFLIPSMLSMLVVSMYSFVDTFVVGQALGAQAVAAMGLGTPVLCFWYSLGFLLGSGGAVLYSVKMAGGEKEAANTIYSCSFLIAIILWILIGILGNLFIRPIALFLGATEGNLQLTIEYLRWMFSLSGFMILDLVLNNFIRNEGHPNVSMVATCTGTGLNIVLDFLFVMVFGWGMSGAASATCIASIISVSINMGYILTHKTNLIPHFKAKNLQHTPEIVKVGFGSFVLEGAISIISVVFLNFAGRYFGDDGVAAFSVLMTFNIVVYSLLNGVAQCIQPLISANFGYHREDRIQKFLCYGMITGIAISAVFLVLAELMPETLVRLFVTDSESITAMATSGLRIHVVSFVFMAISIVAGIYFQAKVKSTRSILILFGRSAAFPIAVVYFLSLWMNGFNLWISIPIGEGMAAILAIALILREENQEDRQP